MSLVPARHIILTDLSTKWGWVTVVNPDTSIASGYVITGAEADAVRTGNHMPPGCTQAQWESGLVFVSARPCSPGQAVANTDGTLAVNYGVSVNAGRITANVMLLQPSEWGVVGGVLNIDSSLSSQIDIPHA